MEEKSAPGHPGNTLLKCRNSLTDRSGDNKKLKVDQSAFKLSVARIKLFAFRFQTFRRPNRELSFARIKLSDVRIKNFPSHESNFPTSAFKLSDVRIENF
jgi:hypothetical protein